MATDNKNPLIHAGLIKRIFFLWLKDFIIHGSKKNLVAEDLYDTIPEDCSKTLRNRLEIAWKHEIRDAGKKKRIPSLWMVLARVYGWHFLKLAALPVTYIVLTIAGPSLLELMMSNFKPASDNRMQAYLHATLFVVLMVVQSLALNNSYFYFLRLGMQVRIACTTLIYKKMLSLTSSTSRNFGNSAITLLTVDVTKLELCFPFLSYIVLVPVQLLITSYLILLRVELDATVASVSLLILLTLPTLAFYNKMFSKIRKKQNVKTDERLSFISEMINGIRSVKMFVWEKYFEERVQFVRSAEIKNYLNISYIGSVMATITNFCHRLCVFAVILVYVPQCGTISADKVLPVAQHFNNLRFGIRLLFHGIRRTADLRVSMNRIEKFLLLEEVDTNIQKHTDNNVNGIISMDNVTATWDDQSHVLENIDIRFDSKKFYAIIGGLGSGKSSLLKLLLGELRLKSGKVHVNGTISYTSQEPWLFPGSIKNNILFDQEYDEQKYNEVVAACALLEDFTYLPYADETVVGDRGTNLSGGQRARINLARAVYRQADIYLLDNPLSAIDTQVAKKVMNECINGLLRDKTKILVTHKLDLLEDFDDLVFLNSGKIQFKGTVENFRKSKLCNEHQPSKQTETFETGSKKLNDDRAKIIVNSPDAAKGPKEVQELIAKGSVSMSVYRRYIRAGGIHRVIFIILLNILFTASVILFDYGLVAWIQDESSVFRIEIDSNSTTSFSGYVVESETKYNKNALSLLGGLIILMVFTSILNNLSLNRFTLTASNNIHNEMLSNLINTILRFFEVNPSGRILNRFSEDTRIVDDLLPDSLSDVAQSTFLVIAHLLSAVIVGWWIIIPSTVSIIFYFFIGRLYLATIQKMTRLVGIAKSPILSFTTSSLDGLTTIRACKAENFVIKDFDSRQDRHTAAQFLASSMLPANALWVELSNLGLLATIVYVCIILKNDETSEAFVGLALMQVMNISAIMANMIIRLVQALSFMPNVERMLQFADLEPEDSLHNQLCSKSLISWPSRGQIKFEKLYLRYSDDTEPVLWNLNFTVDPGSKVGIVGRTGAGKSSLISALFRLAKIEGSLTVDGIDLYEVDLSTLRSKISVIPQEPFLFKATLRKNLDPLSEFEDALLWSALEDVELKASFDTLDYLIESGGNNISLGQRQLLCLARVILKNNKILVLDEATANIDLATDALIQRTIRSKFKECTVLTIAHRLDTVMDSDKILVMDNGRIIEYDQPFVLLQNRESHFSKLVQQTDKATTDQLKAIAE